MTPDYWIAFSFIALVFFVFAAILLDPQEMIESRRRHKLEMIKAKAEAEAMIEQEKRETQKMIDQQWNEQFGKDE